MLSIVVYGRNDSHGYNMHKRVAVSLNAMAEVLCRDDDEIIFVDYATPWPLPTLPEALGDTLTQRCRDRLRVIRVPVETHESLVGDRTHLYISEPLARNIGIRRAAPTSQWILNTNTDMVFVPRNDDRFLPGLNEFDGNFYGIPRFELPEWLWERLDRSDPRGTIALLRQWGPSLGLDEAPLGHPWIMFDAPGDFQLVRRCAIEHVAGFDQRMIWGWHVDSNLSRRLGLAGHELTSLRSHVMGYHTNHDRSPTLLAREQRRGNDLNRFFYDVEDSVPPGQVDDWGLPDADFEEIRLGDRSLSSLLPLIAVDPDRRHGELAEVSTLDEWCRIEYDVRHVVPFAVDFIVADARTAVVAYVGVSAAMRDALSRAVGALGGRVCRLDRDTCGLVDLVVLDLGLGGYAERPAASDRQRLLDLLGTVQEAVDLLAAMRPDCRVVIVNGRSGIWHRWVLDRFQLAPATLPSRVLLATLRNDRGSSHEDQERLENDLQWFSRDASTANPGTASESGRLYFDTGDYSGFADGWDRYDGFGVSIGQSPATLRLEAPRDALREPAFLAVLRRIDYGNHAPEVVEVEAVIDGRCCGSVEFPVGVGVLVAEFQWPGGGSPETPVCVEFLVTRSDGEPYEPRRESQVLNREATWVRLEGLSLVASRHDDGALAPLRFGDSLEGVSCAINGWGGFGGGLVFGSRVGSVRMDRAIPAGSGLVVEVAWVDSYSSPVVTMLRCRVGTEEFESELGPAQPHYRFVFPLVHGAAAGDDVLLSIQSALADAADDSHAWRLLSIGVSSGPEETLAVGVEARPNSARIGLLEGWYWTEPEGVWSSAHKAEFNVRLPPTEVDGSAAIVTLSAFPGGRSTIRVTGDGDEANLIESDGDRRRFALPVRRSAEARIMRVVVEVDELQVPKESPGDDSRRLGAFLESVQLLPCHVEGSEAQARRVQSTGLSRRMLRRFGLGRI